MAAHRYWKLTVTNTVSDPSGYLAIAELLGAESKGGANVLQGITVTSSSTAFSSPVTNLNDGSRSNFFHSNTTPTPHTVTFDFGATAGNWKDVQEIRIVCRTGQVSTAPEDFTWAYSDDNSSYTTIITKTGQTTWDTDGTRRFSNVYHSATCPEGTGYLFHRFVCTETDNTAAVGVGGREMEMHETIGGADYTSTSWFMSITASPEFSPLNLFDNNTGTLASSVSGPFAGSTQGFTVELPQAKPCLEISWTARTDIPSQAPSDFKIQGSKDRITWVDEIVVPSSTGWASGETRTFSGGAGATGRRRQLVN